MGIAIGLSCFSVIPIIEKLKCNEFEFMCSSFILAKKRFVYITETKHFMLHSFMLLQKKKCSAHDSCMQWREICGQMVLGRAHGDIELQLCHDKVHRVSKIFWVPAYQSQQICGQMFLGRSH